jgi:hypothetical protein
MGLIGFDVLAYILAGVGAAVAVVAMMAWCASDLIDREDV